MKILAIAAAALWVPVPHVKPKHHKPKPKPAPPMQTAEASYYDLHGGGACGVGDVQSGYRVANKTMRCGTRLLICFRRCVTATVADRGPYVAGRLFDLNVNTRNATGCPDLCSVRWGYAR